MLGFVSSKSGHAKEFIGRKYETALFESKKEQFLKCSTFTKEIC
jgi:hypothetical protein